MKRLLAFIRKLWPMCGAHLFTKGNHVYENVGLWGDLRCTRPFLHRGPHAWLNPRRYYEPRSRKRPRLQVVQANNPRA